ncbi:hypothetical protein [Pseudomonas aeruginosa]|uniref:hypothetical protein n=1 Tax=Pseudomonas aeruginosa TaxID=287 RepID=UPI003CEA2B2D
MASSPLSNLLLYGETADVAAAKATGVAIALGRDWSPSGSKNLPGELKTARLVSELGKKADILILEVLTPIRMSNWSRRGRTKYWPWSSTAAIAMDAWAFSASMPGIGSGSPSMARTTLLT